MTVKEYLRDHALSGTVVITEIRPKERIVRVAATWFHPQGGGQKSDQGKIGGHNIIHVSHNESEVDHVLDSVGGLSAGEECEFRIDEGMRYLNSVYHTAGHLIAGVVEAEFPGIRPVAGHQWPGQGRIEFEVNSTKPMLDNLRTALERHLACAISAKWPVEIDGEPFVNRAIQIGPLSKIPCGGTHVRSLDQIQEIHVTGIRHKQNRLRVSYEASGLRIDPLS